MSLKSGTRSTLNHILITLLIVAVSYTLLQVFFIKKQLSENRIYSAYLSETTGSIENSIIESTPIFDDYINEKLKPLLRKYPYSDHMAAAAKSGINIVSDAQITEYVQKNKLISINSSDAAWYFYGVPVKYRYVHPDTKNILELIGKKFKDKTESLKISATLKFAVSSALRPAEYQSILKKTNMNAINESTHSSGLSIDIFFDDFYISLDENPHEDEKELAKLRIRAGYMLGDSLRRQLKTILTEILIDLQNQGYLMMIYEHKQRCYHITVLKSAEDY